MSPKDEEEHARCERVESDRYIAIEGVQELATTMQQLQIVAQRSEEMMINRYQLLYWMLVHELREHALKDE